MGAAQCPLLHLTIPLTETVKTGMSNLNPPALRAVPARPLALRQVQALPAVRALHRQALARLAAPALPLRVHRLAAALARLQAQVQVLPQVQELPSVE